MLEGDTATAGRSNEMTAAAAPHKESRPNARAGTLRRPSFFRKRGAWQERSIERCKEIIGCQIRGVYGDPRAARANGG